MEFDEELVAKGKDFLEHYGTPRHSGRYPYGSGSRPYQGESSSFREKIKKKLASLSGPKKTEAQKKAESAEKAKQKAEKKEAKKQAAVAKKRQEILRDPRQLRKHQYEYSAEEIQEALKRFEWDKKLSDYTKAQVQSGADYMNSASSMLASGTKMWNSIAATYNAFSKLKPGDTNAMPIIDTSTATKSKDKNSSETNKKGDSAKPTTVVVQTSTVSKEEIEKMIKDAMGGNSENDSGSSSSDEKNPESTASDKEKESKK